ncbi:MAG: O-antigen ligase family protein [Desulfovibrio sp.]|jgi:O-antigen ligase|nr:O-antigen ligase family protein [Desulfovibrio sp.]
MEKGILLHHGGEKITLYSLDSLFRQLICLVAFCVFLCNMFWISNKTPLFVLGACGAASFFLRVPSRFQNAMLPFVIFFLYKVVSDVFLFPESSGAVMHRPMCAAFLGGIAVQYVFRDRDSTFLVCLLAGITLMAVIVFPASFLTNATESLFHHGDRLMILFNHPNGLAAASATGAITALCFLLSRPMRLSRAVGVIPRMFVRLGNSAPFLWSTLAICVVMLWLTASRTSFYVTVPVFVLLVFPRAASFFAARKRIAVALLVAAAVLAVPILSVNKNRIADSRMGGVFVHGPQGETSFRSRMPGWESALAAFSERPWLGNGPESFAGTHAVYMRQNYERLVGELGETMVQTDTLVLPHAHNQYLMELSEHGIIGLVLFLLLFAVPFWKAIKHRTLYGACIPVLAFFLFLGVLEAPFYGSRSASFAITAVFMILGYLSSIRHDTLGSTEPQPEPVRAS